MKITAPNEISFTSGIMLVVYKTPPKTKVNKNITNPKIKKTMSSY